MEEHPIRHLTTPFSQWAALVKAQSSTSSNQLYEGGGSSHPLSSQACIDSCYGLLGAMDAFHLGGEACRELVSDGVYQTLGEGTAADWEGISKRLAKRAGTQACNPSWLQEDSQESCDSVHARIKQACCASEVAVLMLRLAVRAACLAGSWYGPWDSKAALAQLTKAGAWLPLLRALRALLATFGPNLAKQYNAINIASDILHIFYSLSERHAHRDFQPADVNRSHVPWCLTDAVTLVVDHAAHLPFLHRRQAAQRDTALLLAPSMMMMVVKSMGPKHSQLSRRMAQPGFRKLCWDALCAFEAGRLPGDLGDWPEVLDTGCVQRAAPLLLYITLTRDCLTKGKFLCMPWEEFCNVVPVPKVRSLIDQWLLSSEIARFGPSTSILHLALNLMRMISCCRGRAEFLGRSGMLLRCVHLLRHILAACPATPEVDRGDGASRRKLLRPPAEPARMPWDVEHGWQLALWKCLSEGVTCLMDYLGHPWRPDHLPPDGYHLSAFPSQCVGTRRTALYQEGWRKRWARYDARVEAMLGAGAPGVVESLLRHVARTTRAEELGAYEVQALMLAHTMLHHPTAWPKQEAALGLLISLRKFFDTQWDRLPWGISHANSATLPIALLTAMVRKEALLPDLTTAFAATQLLPAISDALSRHFYSTSGQLYCPHLCKELLTMCSYLASSSAWPVLLGHRTLISLAAEMVFVTSSEGLAAYREASPLLDLGCMHAAACDLAMADAAFGTAVSTSGVGMAQALIRIAQRAQWDFPASPERYYVVALMGFQFARFCASGDPDSSAHAFYQPFVSTIASVLGAVPDWRATAFWASSSFRHAWENFYKERSRRAGEDPEASIRYISMASATLDAETGRPVTSPAQKAAAEQLEARSLLLAGQAGLCCNRRCTEMSGRHERSLRTMRCGGGCQHGRFCSKRCQKQAWPVHRLVCLDQQRCGRVPEPACMEQQRSESTPEKLRSEGAPERPCMERQRCQSALEAPRLETQRCESAPELACMERQRCQSAPEAPRLEMQRRESAPELACMERRRSGVPRMEKRRCESDPDLAH